MTEPDDAVWRALLDFRARHGKDWREKLSIAWMNGSDASEPRGSELRHIRNRFGPSWVCDLAEAELDAHTMRLRLEATLPAMCATLLPSTLEPVVIKRGERAYWPLPEGATAERINEIFAASPAHIAAREIGCLFGWDVPGADPAHYDSFGRPLRAAGG
ncbi:hypothetical protein K3M67_06505 [Sphingobium sp. V4]|uniref:hypothetical protein n=1 Tax=Sphingobium sp. V4 TaxID=3038927 RepID=UPI0025581270|nr:hypothetical protein [Sphingobium sp. V4]WIW89605.1 hypothetical protein K3M67_06505 [Sphingobium sp. V4]